MTKLDLIKSEVKRLEIIKNEISGRYERDRKAMEDEDFNTFYLEMCEKCQVEKLKYPSKQMIYDVIESNWTPSYNPLRELLIKEKPVYTNNAIKELSSTIETDTGFSDSEFFPSYTDTFIRKWLVNMVATALDTVDNPLLLALLGGQNTGKTWWLRHVLPPELKPYYIEMPIQDGHDFYAAMSQAILIMDDELSGKTRAELEKFKRIMSTSQIDYRKKYGRNLTKARRRASICGTGNELRILNDYTGNRRIIPINVLNIDHNKYNGIDKLDVLREAYHLYKTGFDFRLSKDEIKILNSSTIDFEYLEEENEVLIKYFDKAENDNNVIWLSTAEIKEMINQYTGNRNLSYVKIGKALKRLEFDSKHIRKGKSTLKRFAISSQSEIFSIEQAKELKNGYFGNN